MSYITVRVPFYYGNTDKNGNLYTKEALLNGLGKMSNIKILNILENKQVVWTEVTYEKHSLTSQQIEEIRGEDFID